MTQIEELEGPSQGPASGTPPKQLVVFCHGLGSDGSDLIGLGHYFSKTLPDAMFLSPNAPFRFDLATTGYQWFSLENASPEARLIGVQTAAPIINRYIDKKLKEYNLEDNKLALVGFSQGTMLALHIGLRRDKEIAGIIGYSGSLIAEELLRTEVVSRPSVLLVHGDTDEIVPPDALKSSVDALVGAGIEANGEMRPGLGHSLDDRGILLGMDFLAHCFGVSL